MNNQKHTPTPAKYQVRVLEPVIVTKHYETASWYTNIQLTPGAYPMIDVSFGITKQVRATIPGTITASFFENRLFTASSHEVNKDVGKSAAWCEYYNLDPHGYWDKSLSRHKGKVLIEPIEAIALAEKGETK